MTLGLPSAYSAPVRGRDHTDPANSGRLLGGAVTWGKLHFHLELPGCSANFRHVHAHSTRSRAPGWPILAETIRIVESLGYGFGDTGPPYQPVCGHPEGLGVRVLDDGHPKAGVWWACKGCLLDGGPDLYAGTLRGGGP